MYLMKGKQLFGILLTLKGVMKGWLGSVTESAEAVWCDGGGGAILNYLVFMHPRPPGRHIEIDS